MSDYPTCTWPGSSGKKYEFSILPLDFDFPENQNGNYIFAKIVNNAWHAVYIGEGDLTERTKFRIEDGCVIRKKATHIHAHLNPDKASRKAEEKDLLDGNSESYTSVGCNIKEGG